MITALIIDDEPKNIRILQGLLEEFCPQVDLAGVANGVEAAVQLIRDTNPDLLFLDVEMPFGNGFDLLDKLRPVNFEVIFVTAFDEYVLKAFKYSALDYLLKPVSIDELKAAVQKAEEKVKNKNINRQLENLFHYLGNRVETRIQKIALPEKDDLVFVPVQEIIRCEAKGSCTYIYATGKRRYVSSESIKIYEELLPGNIFFRIHNSHIINLEFVKKYQKGRGGYVEMPDDALLEVASRRKDEFLARFGYK